MKVKDFIKELEKLPQDAELFAKEEHGWFYPADIIEEDAVYENQYNILGKVQHVECENSKNVMRQNSEGGSIMITDEQIVKDWNIVKRCENCANRGPTTCTNTGDGPRHECWCKLKGNPGPIYPLYGLGCSKWKLCKWIRDNYERELTGEEK